MKIFIDTSSIEDIKTWDKLGFISGVTTNPALLSKENGQPIEILKEICALMGDRPVSAQVTTEDPAKMVAQGVYFSKLADNVLVKLPANLNGYKALIKLNQLKIKTNITLCFDPVTACLFAKAGATYVSMIIGRSEDFNLYQSSLIKRTKAIFENNNFNTKILGASFRNPQQIELAMSQGADVLTIPPSSLSMLFNNPLTNGGLQDFEDAWKTIDEEDKKTYDYY